MIGVGWWDGFAPWIGGWIDGFRVLGANALVGGLVGALVGLVLVGYLGYQSRKDTVEGHRVYWDDE